MRKISFVIPCYKSDKTIKAVADEIRDTVKKAGKDEYEIILINDCSGEPTWNAICDLCNEDKNIKGINLAKNVGQHNALMAGIGRVSGDIIVCLDDDGQTPADEVYSLIYELEKGYDVVYSRYSHKEHTGIRNFGSWVNGKMLELMLDKPPSLYVSSYFVMQRFIADEISKYKNPYTYMMGLVLRTTSNISSVEVKHRSRLEGVSGYSMKKLLALWINGLTAFSVKPLRIATFSGLIFVLLGIAYAIFAIINKFTNPNAPLGWTTIIVLMLLIGGMTLSVLGMIGEYLGRMYICQNDSPQYVVREIRN